MSIQSEIERIESNIANTYSELEEQGADMPSARNSTNLAATAATTKTVKYIAQSLTAAQQAQARENIGAVSEDELPTAFYVTVEGADGVYLVDKTLAEIAAAYIAGKPIYCRCSYDENGFSGENVILPLVTFSEEMALFGTFVDAAIAVGVMDGGAMVMTQRFVNNEELQNSTVQTFEQELTDIAKANARKNINAAGHFYGVCDTEAADAAKTINVDSSFSLVEGTQITVRFTNSNSIASPTLNVNGTGAKPIYRYGTTAASTSTTTTGWTAGAIQIFTYNGTGWVRDYWSNTTYSNVALGQGYATCSTAAATKAKTASLSSYSLTTGGIVSVRFTYDVPAGATLNINSKGAKAIYHRDAAITDGVIKAGDIATFIYSTYYRLISIDRISDVVTVKDYGAKGDNSTDDTAAFQNALAAQRVVYVPGGSYKLSGELTIGSNCQLELAQDAVLYFTNTSGNCISMKMSACLKGNHATISVPYAFTGNVINLDTGLNESGTECPPFTRWDPMWKTARYISDINIVKPDTRGFYYSMDGSCNGTALYAVADPNNDVKYMWGTLISGLRIAGAFTYGIYANSSNSWNHDMRIEAVMDACETGVYLLNTSNVYLDVIIQPRRAYTTDEEYIPYAKHGFYLENANNIDMTKSKVWDWDAEKTLWSPGGQNQPLVMIGTCKGIIVPGYYYVHASAGLDFRRDYIYTDTPSNLERITILQEPFTRWFKPVDGVPYFNDGDAEKKLVLQEELNEIVDTERVPNFTNKVPTAIDLDGTIFNGIGYKPSGARWNYNTGTLSADEYYGCVGLIPAKSGDIIRGKNLSYASGDGYCGLVFFNSSRSKIGHVAWSNLISNGSYYWSDNYKETEDGFEVQISTQGGEVLATSYVAFTFRRAMIGENPIITINEEYFSYSQVGYLQDSVKVKAENVEGLSDILGSYIDDVDALLGGG